MPNPVQGWGTNDQPVSGGGFGANDTPVGAPQGEVDIGEQPASLVGVAKTMGRQVLRAAMAPGESLVNGARELATPGTRLRGAAHIIEGAGKGALMLAAPEMAANPAGALVAGAAGTGLSKLAGAGTRALGGSEDAARLAEDVAPLGLGRTGGDIVGRGVQKLGAPFPAAVAVSDAVANPAGKLTDLVGRGLQRLAQPFVRLGLKLPPTAHDYGAQPEEAALRLTHGTDPEDIENQANATMENLTNQRNAALSSAGARGVKVPLAPSRGLVNAGIQSQQAGNDVPREMLPIREHFEVPHPGFTGAVMQPPTPMVQSPSSVLGPNGQPLMTLVPGTKPPARVADYQPPMDFQRMKQVLQSRFANFTPGESSREAVDLANQVHHQMGSDLETAVPGTAPLNKDIQSLIPLAKRAHATMLNAGPIENAVDAATRPTGRLAAPFIAGSVGGPLAAAATFGTQQALSSPRNMIRMARGLYGMGGQSQAAKNAARILPLLLQDNGQ